MIFILIQYNNKQHLNIKYTILICTIPIIEHNGVAIFQFHSINGVIWTLHVFIVSQNKREYDVNYYIL